MIVLGRIMTERDDERSGSKAKDPKATGPVASAPGISVSCSRSSQRASHQTSAAVGESVSNRVISPRPTMP